MSTSDPPQLQVWLAELERIGRRIWDDGIAVGNQDLLGKMQRAVAANLGAASLPPPGDRIAAPPLRPGGAGFSTDSQFGIVVRTFREALLASPETGITQEEMIEYCHRKGLIVTMGQYRDTMKRLVAGREAEKHHGAFFPGKDLRRELTMAGTCEAARLPASELGSVRESDAAQTITSNVAPVSIGGRPGSLRTRSKVAARETILTEGQPIPVSDLCSKLRSLGIDIGGKKPAWVLSSYLCGDEAFLSVKGRGWWVSDRPVPPRPPRANVDGDLLSLGKSNGASDHGGTP
jgi:hypothetical protein